MNKYWFKPKTYGYGYVPISIEGWVATIFLILLGLLVAHINNFFNPATLTLWDSLLFLIEILILGYVFLELFKKRCKGRLKWKWGNKSFQ